MKNVTITLDAETHRAARIAAAERGLSLSALVRNLLDDLRPAGSPQKEALHRVFAAMDGIREFSAKNRLTREEMHDR